MKDPVIHIEDSLEVDNYWILKRRPDLRIQGDFTEDGRRYHNNSMMIEVLKRLPVRLVAGGCSCATPIPRTQYEIIFCAWCHKELKTDQPI